MQKHAGGLRGGRVGLIAAIAAVFCLAFAAMAVANNLDIRTAQNAAKFAAKKECQQTSGCQGYGASNIRRVTRHKAVGKIFVNSVKNGSRFQCRQQIVIHLDHFTGDIRYALSGRRCVNLGPA